jgi:uncharacterized membrane protein YhaH (DUF805 family)
MIEIRRFHDFDFSGYCALGRVVVLWWLYELVAPSGYSDYLLIMVDVVWIGFLLIIPGTRGPNRFGPDPLGHQPP